MSAEQTIRDALALYGATLNEHKRIITKSGRNTKVIAWINRNSICFDILRKPVIELEAGERPSRTIASGPIAAETVYNFVEHYLGLEKITI